MLGDLFFVIIYLIFQKLRFSIFNFSMGDEKGRGPDKCRFCPALLLKSRRIRHNTKNIKYKIHHNNKDFITKLSLIELYTKVYNIKSNYRHSHTTDWDFDGAWWFIITSIWYYYCKCWMYLVKDERLIAFSDDMLEMYIPNEIYPFVDE